MQTGTAGNDRARVMARARELTEHDDFEGAFQAYAQALDKQCGDGELHYLAGMMAWRALRYAEAGRHLGEAVRIAPRHPAPRQALADWSAIAGDVRAALAHSEVAMSIAPNGPEVLATRAEALAASGAVAQAWGIVKRLCEGPYVPLRVYGLRGRLAPPVGGARTSLRLFLSPREGASRFAPDIAPLHFAAARLLEAEGD